jgi:hypothetical protein
MSSRACALPQAANWPMNPANIHLLELARQVRGCTLRSLEGVPLAWQRWAPPGTSNHILWHAGHVLWVLDLLAIEPLTGQSELPAGWAETFGADCRPVRETNQWPEMGEIAERLQLQLTRLIAALETTPAERLSDIAAPSADWNLPRGIIHGLHDEARHQGEIHLLQKLCRARGA